MLFVIAGEPLPSELEDWYFEVIGNRKCLLIDAWGQTGESVISRYFETVR